MSSIYEIYSSGIKNKLKNYWPAWLPSTLYKLGDVGFLKGNYFERVTSLAELDIDFDIEDDESPSPLELVSESGVTLQFKIAGETNTAFASVPDANAGVKLDFGESGAFVIECPETFEPFIMNTLSLEKKLLDAFEKDVWDKNWHVITRIIASPSSTIVISNSSSSGLEFTSNADLSTGFVKLGSAEANLSLKSQTGDLFKMIGARDTTPFFQLSRLKRKFLGNPKLRIKSMFERGNISFIGHDDFSKKDVGQVFLDVTKDDELNLN